VKPVPIGAEADLDVVVTPEMTVRFDELGPVHPVYATYSMARHFEEAGRKLLLRHLEEGEAGIGRAVSVEHLAPSRVGDTIRVTARCTRLEGARLTCECRAVDTRGQLLGHGSTVQVVLPRDVLEARLGAGPGGMVSGSPTVETAPGRTRGPAPGPAATAGRTGDPP
jgi:fluoroacetyl-CoA thioesterase